MLRTLFNMKVHRRHFESLISSLQEAVEYSRKERELHTVEYETTFPDCPTCMNMTNGDCIYKDLCFVMLDNDGIRVGIPSEHKEGQPIMATKLYGSIIPWPGRDEEKYHFDGERFFYEDGRCLSEEDLKYWALWLNSPWSQANIRFTIEANCKDAYTEIPENEPLWRCVYECVGYEAITATLIGYGNTAPDALSDCVNLLSAIQEKYNPEDDSM